MTVHVGTLNNRGQITIPQELRAILGLNGGDRVLFALRDGALTARRLMSVDEVAGSVPALDPPLTERQINEIIQDERAQEYARKNPGLR